ncbi:lantibiotic dehydratase family protein [Kitasatospora sp. NBC_01287]|uniref:lantibiotic dehydratase n=1 Tax=Kitasatospora sp. NBC_01287 TaxID=2903573 RepID=UPI00224D6AF8|nr:lantibiotic dehydratase [Kitasatospora sp. NBC_01287]MCX4745737.1 lantibiotic dehydratase family protein [Kitasatospora sp. NBC_01287]
MTSERALDHGLGRYFMLRVGGLPVDAVHGLRAPQAFDWAERLLTEEERLAELGARLSEPLSARVRTIDDAARRRELLALRRQVFNNRLPTDVAAARALAAGLDSATGALLTEWLDARQRLARLDARGEPTLTAELAATRAALQKLAERDELRLGLLLASPALADRLGDDRPNGGRPNGDRPNGNRPSGNRPSDPAAPLDKRARKLERSLLSYLYRTACKTSPFSTFTPVALGHFTAAPTDQRTGHPAELPSGELPSGELPSGELPSGELPSGELPPGELPPGELLLGAARSSHPRLNVVALARLAELIAADPVRRRDLPLTLASGWELTDDRVRYVQRSVTAADGATPVSFDAARDRLFFLRLSGVLEQLIELFGGRALIRYGELADLLHAEAGGSTADAERYLRALLEVGMLQLPALATDVHAADPVRAFQAALRALDRPWATATAERLAGPAAVIDRYPAADAPTRRTLLAELRGELTELQQSLDATAGPVPQTLLYEDVAAGETGADGARWAALAARPLAELAPILPLFDLGLAQRLTLKGFFLARYGRGGRCTDLLQLVHDFHEDIFDQYLQFTALAPARAEHGGYPPEENWLGLPELTALDRARAELARRMRGHWEEHAEEHADEGAEEGAEEHAEERAELLLTAADLAAVAAELAPLGQAFAPHSHFVQLAAGGPGREPLVVLNHSYGGLAFPFTRFTHCFAQPTEAPTGALAEPPTGPLAASSAGPPTEPPTEPPAGPPTDLPAALREGLRAAQPAGAVFAEVTAGAATTNLNLHARLTDYELVCPGETSTAPAAARLHLEDLVVEHDEVADRLLLRSRRLDREVVPVYLGYLVPMVLPQTPRSLLLFSPTSRVTPELWRGVPTGPATEGVTHRPRVRYGRLVLHRRSWTVTAEALPRPRPGQREADRFLDWQRWRRRHRLPTQLFARLRPESDSGGQLGTTKPQYVDFASPLSLLALDGLLGGGPGRLVLEEMLPGDDDLHVRSAEGRHVAELALEILPPPHPAPRTAPAPRSTPEGEPSRG